MLEQKLFEAVAREKVATAEVLRLLREVEKQRLFLERGYSSMYAYCTERLGYSEPEAQLRIASMRLARQVPEAMNRLERGAMTLSVAALIHSAARKEPLLARELVGELSGKSKREAEALLARRFPKRKPREKTKQISEDLVEIRFTVSREEAEMIKRLLDRKAHTNFERSKAKLFVELARAALEKLERKPQEDALPHRPDKARSRHVPSPTRRHVWRRDEARCQFEDPLTGKTCGTRHGLQLDHVQPYAPGGSNAAENLRLLCGAHNRARNYLLLPK